MTSPMVDVAVGRGQRAERPAHAGEPVVAQDPDAGQLVEVGGHAEHLALGEQAQRAAAPHVGAAGGG